MKPEFESSNTNTNRIAKVIARSGLCSRREAERLILNGNVKDCRQKAYDVVEAINWEQGFYRKDIGKL